MHTFIKALLLLLLAVSCLVFCQKETFTSDPKDALTFSTDTLRFDTVFTQLGSATRILKVYNPHKKSIRIARIFLENGASSRFNLNVDGIAGDDQKDIEIAPKDSLYVFVEVTVNPNEQSSPFVIAENIVFETNGNVQKTVVEAWGQNAIYLTSRFGAGSVYALNCQNGEIVLDDPRPYVLYGILVVDSCTLRIPAGAHIYVHGGLGKITDGTTVERYNDGFFAFVGKGRLIVEGTLERPVIFEGDRLEQEFDEDAGQWTGIWLQQGTTGHVLEHCIIKNSIIGVRVDSAADLRLRNTQIFNTGGSGLIGIHANVRAENCLFHSNVGYGIQLEYGGDYDFKYCTVASYGVDGEALRMGNALCFDAGCEAYAAFPLKARFENCILMGGRPDQITLFDRIGNDPSLFDYKLENCVVRVRELLKPGGYPDFLTHCAPCLNIDAQDTLFLDTNNQKFRLDSSGSVANRYARPISGIDRDLDGKLRDPLAPDAGCYEIEF
jgi:hypothetical protein